MRGQMVSSLSFLTGAPLSPFPLAASNSCAAIFRRSSADACVYLVRCRFCAIIAAFAAFCEEDMNRRPREIRISAPSTHATHVASGKAPSPIGEAPISRQRPQA